MNKNSTLAAAVSGDLSGPCSDWGTPNWKNTEAYDFVSALSAGKKRWEFLRRLPQYRAAWCNRARSGRRFGLLELIDPTLHCNSLTVDQEWRLSALEGQPLGLLMPPPPIEYFLSSEVPEVKSKYAMQVGNLVLEYVQAGYVFFITNPSISSNEQAKSIEIQLSNFLLEMKVDCGSSVHRINGPRQHGDDRWLRVLDAYHQEGVLTSLNEHRAKTRIGREIFASKKDSDGTAWHKVADAAYSSAINIALIPPLRKSKRHKKLPSK